MMRWGRAARALQSPPLLSGPRLARSVRPPAATATATATLRLRLRADDTLDTRHFHTLSRSRRRGKNGQNRREGRGTRDERRREGTARGGGVQQQPARAGAVEPQRAVRLLSPWLTRTQSHSHTRVLPLCLSHTLLSSPPLHLRILASWLRRPPPALQQLRPPRSLGGANERCRSAARAGR